MLILAIVLCGCRAEQPSSRVFDEARRELESRGHADQKIREGYGNRGKAEADQAIAMGRVDSANTAWLKTYVARNGWPTKAQVGKEAVDAAFLIVQHATQDTAFMRTMLPSITESYHRGDISGGAVATLIDRIEVKAGRPQIYGTQLSLQNGRWILDPIGDSSHVDERRKKMGLSTLAEYLRVVDSVLRSP